MHEGYKNKEITRLPKMSNFICFYLKSLEKLTRCKRMRFSLLLRLTESSNINTGEACIHQGCSRCPRRQWWMEKEGIHLCQMFSGGREGDGETLSIANRGAHKAGLGNPWPAPVISSQGVKEMCCLISFQVMLV